MRWLLTCLALLAALPCFAQHTDGIASRGLLSDDDFYRLAACGAPVGGKCSGNFVSWPRKKLTVALTPADKGFPAPLLPKLSRALDQAIAEINGAGANITLLRNDRRRAADIIVTPSALRAGGLTHDTPRMPDGLSIGVGQMYIWWEDNKRITKGAILIAADIRKDEIQSVMLEELFQSMGFLFDIENPKYEGRSILAQYSNSTTQITGQDRMLLLRHYPPK